MNEARWCCHFFWTGRAVAFQGLCWARSVSCLGLWAGTFLSAACLCCGARKHLLFRLPGRKGIGYLHGNLPVPSFHLVCLCLFISFISCARLPKCCFIQDKFNTSRDAVCVQKSIYKASSRSFHQKTEFSKRYSRMDV